MVRTLPISNENRINDESRRTQVESTPSANHLPNRLTSTFLSFHLSFACVQLTHIRTLTACINYKSEALSNHPVITENAF